MRKNQYTNTKLEVKKIPQELNNITKLNEHFSKFGTIVNIQVHVAVLVTESMYLSIFLNIPTSLFCLKEPVINLIISANTKYLYVLTFFCFCFFIFFIIFLLLYCCSIIVVCSSSPPLPPYPSQTHLPPLLPSSPLVLSMYPL